MKGAIGNAFIMNLVITFIIIFFSLLIGGMAYSKAYRVKNFLINEIELFERQDKHYFNKPLLHKNEWDETVNKYLGNIGYPLASNYSSCPDKSEEGFTKWIWSEPGRYDYCIYNKMIITDSDNDRIYRQKYYYQVKVFMKMDLPVVGKMIRIPITSETKTYAIYR